MSNHLTYWFGVHTGVLDKPDEASRRLTGKGWQDVEMSEADVVGCILNGWAIAPQYRGGHRKTSNFIRSGFLAADVDAGMTLEEAQDHPFVQHHAALIHTTASHTAARPRLRIIFLLDEPILSAPDWADAQMGIARRMGSDASVSDGARMFFGNSRAIFVRISRTVPPTVVAELIACGRDARASRAVPGQPIFSARRFAGPELVRVAGGDLVRFEELGVPARVHCPYHDDADPSAYTVRFRTGTIGIHCSACKVTFGSNDRPDGYDFGSFDRIFEQLRARENDSDPDAKGLERYFPPAPRFERTQERYLPSLVYEPGITAVKSAKGSGKTERLRLMVVQIRAGQFRADIFRKDQPKSILLIGHRQALLRELAAKLGLHCYLDGGDGSEGTLRTLAVTLDSLPLYNESKRGTSGKAFDLVIIDESEQVLGHLFGKTIERRLGVERCFDALHFEVANAKAVIALDADLGLVTMHALRTMRPQDWASRCRIIYNSPLVPVQRRVMRLHSDIKNLEREMIAAIQRGERCFIVSNSKKYIDVAHRMILNLCGEDVVMRVITSDNSRDEAVIRFLANIKTEFLIVQVVMGTPSIGTGIDITFPNGECRVDRVFGFFHPFINTHMDVDQQLCRVRNPGMVDVWIGRATAWLTCTPEIIMDDLARSYAVKRAVTGRREDGMIEYDRDEPLLMIYTHVIALQRASKNRLVELFCELRRANGWEVEFISDVEPQRYFKAAKKMVEAERREMLRNAKPLSSDDYIELDSKMSKGASVTKEERIRYERSHFERTVGIPLDGELIEMNVDGKLLDKVVTLAGVVSVSSQRLGMETAVDVLLAPTTTAKGRLQKLAADKIIAALMRAAGMITSDGVSTSSLISITSLSRFVDVCRNNRTTIEEALGIALRGDIAERPIRQLNEVLRFVALRVVEVDVRKESGRKIRYYSVQAELWATMMRLACSYQDAEARRETDNKHAPRRRRSVIMSEVPDSPRASLDMGLLSPAILRKD